MGVFLEEEVEVCGEVAGDELFVSCEEFLASVSFRYPIHAVISRGIDLL